jgi:hypothetical protein
MINKLSLGVVQLRIILGPEDERAPSTPILYSRTKLTNCKLVNFGVDGFLVLLIFCSKWPDRFFSAV